MVHMARTLEQSPKNRTLRFDSFWIWRSSRVDAKLLLLSQPSRLASASRSFVSYRTLLERCRIMLRVKRTPCPVPPRTWWRSSIWLMLGRLKLGSMKTSYHTTKTNTLTNQYPSTLGYILGTMCKAGKALPDGDTGGGPDREQELQRQLSDLKSQVMNLQTENVQLKQERHDLTVELNNIKASETGGQQPDEGENEISSDAARKRLFRLCKRAADGQLVW